MMAAKQPPWLAFDFSGTGTKKKFYSKEEAVEYFREEVDFYGWLQSYTNETGLSTVASHVFNSTYHTLHGLTNQSQYGDEKVFLESQLPSLYYKGGLPTHDSADGKFLSLIKSKHGDRSALGALGYMTGRLGGAVTNADAFRGAAIAFLRERGGSEEYADSSRAELEALVARLSEQSKDLTREIGDSFNDISKNNQNQDHKHHVQRRWYERKFRRLMNEHRSRCDHSISEFEQTRKTYEELMKLKAPVDYWRDKAKAHKDEAQRYRSLLVWHSRWAAPLLLIFLAVLSWLSFAFSDANKPATAYLLLVTIGVVVTTMAFWAARIVVRFYMSEHHLAIDAEERATMAMTYLALIEKGVVNEKDRALILAPLFRPSTDGIVKDDAAPDLSPGGLLSKALSK